MTDPAALLEAARRQLASFPALLDGLVAELDSAAWRARPTPTEWAPVEIVCHLRDEEVEDFGARVRAVVAGQGRFAPIDPEGWAVTRRYLEADPAAALSAFRGHRAATLALLADVAPADLLRTGESPSGTRLSGLDLVAAWVTHDRLHLRQLAGVLARVGRALDAPPRGLRRPHPVRGRDRHAVASRPRRGPHRATRRGGRRAPAPAPRARAA